MNLDMELWSRPAEMSPGIYHALKIFVPEEALRTDADATLKGVHWLQLLPGFSAGFTVIFTTGEAVGDPCRAMGPAQASFELLFKYVLQNGNVVWLHAHRMPSIALESVVRSGRETFAEVFRQARRFGLSRAIAHIRPEADKLGAFTLIELPIQ